MAAQLEEGEQCRRETEPAPKARGQGSDKVKAKAAVEPAKEAAVPWVGGRDGDVAVRVEEPVVAKGRRAPQARTAMTVREAEKPPS